MENLLSDYNVIDPGFEYYIVDSVLLLNRRLVVEGYCCTFDYSIDDSMPIQF